MSKRSTDSRETRSPSDWGTSLTDLSVILLFGGVYALSVWIGGVPSVSSQPITSEFLDLVQVALGLLLVLFTPGYLFLVIVSPQFGPDDGFAWGERFVLSFLISIVYIVIQALLLDWVGGGVAPEMVMVLTTGTVIVGTLLAATVRVLREEGPAVINLNPLHSLIDRATSPPSRVDLGLNIALAALLIMTCTVIVLPSVGDETAEFTEVALLTENDSDALIAANVSSVFEPESPQPLVTSITNHEHDRQHYTLVVQAQSAVVGDRSVQILNRHPLDTYNISLEHNETGRVRYQINAPSETSGCRIAFLLYIDDVPATPTTENAYRELHLWNGAPPSIRAEACSAAAEIEVIRD